MPAKLSVGVIVAYGLMLALIVAFVEPRISTPYGWSFYLLVGITLLFLARYLSTRYSMDDSFLFAWRIFGSRKVPLEDVRAIEYASLRDLAPTGGILGIGSLGWRGHMYSPTIGEFDSIYTDPSHGLLISEGAYPLYISPQRPEEFARELSRRARSYSGPLLKDVGGPPAIQSADTPPYPPPPSSPAERPPPPAGSGVKE